MSVGEGLQSRLAGYQFAALIAAGVGLAGSLVAFFAAPQHSFPAYLTAFLFWCGLSVGSLALLMLHILVGGNWGLPIRRFLEIGAVNVIPMIALFLPILFGLRSIYPWAEPAIYEHDELIKYKVETLGFLTPSAFAIRAFVFFLVWGLIAWFTSRTARANENAGTATRSRAVDKFSGLLMAIMFFTGTFAAIDWNMTREPAWYSSMYGPMVLIGWGLEAFAFTIGLTILLAPDHEPLKRVATVERMHDLANLMFAFTILWAYTSFSQFLITWMGNLAEEAPWYLRRSTGGWQAIVAILILFHFFVPFFALLFKPIKRNPRTLLIFAALLLGMHLLDLTWLTIPANAQYVEATGSHDELAHMTYTLSPVDLLLVLLAFAGIGGAWILAFLWQLRDTPLVSGDALAANGYQGAR